MALKSLFFVVVLVLTSSSLLAEAQLLGGLGGLLGGGLPRIQGTLFCTANGGMGVNGAATPVFPNARVQLQCGTGNVVASATTNNAGLFSILLDPLQFLLSSLLSNCNLVVNTPLSACDASLPIAGILTSPLQLIGRTVSGVLTIINIIPLGFNLLN